MGLLSALKRKLASASSANSSPDMPDSVEQARTRARQRLLGAAVLVVAGVVGFSLAFDTPPRSIAVDVPIEVAGAESAAVGKPDPAVLDSGRIESAAQGEAAPEPSREPAAAPAAVQTPRAEPKAQPGPGVVEPKPAAKPAVVSPKPVPKPAAPTPVEKKTSPSESARAQALLEGKPVAAADSARFVVQVGAFGEPDAARDMRARVEKLGFKTYTQAVETGAGKRIRVRVGPYNSRDEADRAASKLKAAGLVPAVLTL